MKNSFFLVIPEQRNAPQVLAAFAEPALEQWVADLPTGNPGLATRLFQDLLEELISLQMSTANRMASLEMLRSSFLMIEDYLRSRLTKMGFPKAEAEKKIFTLLVLLERHFTIGYWIVVRDLTRREVGWLQGKSTVTAMQRTIKGLSSVVVSHYIMSYSVPDWIWYDLHSLYKLSVKLGKSSTRINEPAGVYSKSSSIEASYKQVLLLSLAFPSGLMQREFQLVYDFIEKIADYVTIETKPVTDQSMQCLILIDEDLPPSFISKVDEPLDKRSDSSRLYLNFTKLYKLFKQPEKLCSKEEGRFSVQELSRQDQRKLSFELFDYLVQRWQGKELHGATLFTDRLNRYLSIGFDATHDLQDTNQPPVGGLEIVAESHSERALSCNFEKEGMLSIGSLVSFRRTDGAIQQRVLGIVCKIQLPKQDSNKLFFEISLIAQQSYSVTYLYPDATGDSEHKKALLYGIKQDGQERSYIILESFMIKDSDVLRMFMGQESFPIILNGRKNIGLGYWQFECRRIVEKLAQPQAGKKGYDFI